MMTVQGMRACGDKYNLAQLSDAALAAYLPASLLRSVAVDYLVRVLDLVRLYSYTLPRTRELCTAVQP
jgi:hypothetical protein